MAQKRKYKRYSKGGRFKQSGQGLRTSVGEIASQRNIEIDAIKLQQAQAKEINKDLISGTSDVARAEQENSATIQNLETKIFQNKYRAIEKRAQTEVESILGQAKEKEKASKFWEKFATKHSWDLYKGAKGLSDFAQFKRGQYLHEQLYDEGLSFDSFPEIGANSEINKLALQAINNQKHDWNEEEIKENIKFISGNSNPYLAGMLAKDWEKNKETIIQSTVNDALVDGKSIWNKKTAKELLMTRAYLFLQKHDINPRSKAGSDILTSTRLWANAKTIHLTGVDGLATDQEEIQKLAKIHLSSNTRASMENLVTYVKNGYYKSQTAKGWGKGDLSWAQAYELAGKAIVDNADANENLTPYFNHAIPGTEWTEWTTDQGVEEASTKQSEIWSVKHPRITEQILNHQVSRQNAIKKRADLQVEGDAIVRNEDIKKEIRENPELLNDFSNDGYIRKLIKEGEAADTHASTKKLITRLTNYKSSTHGPADAYNDFMHIVTTDPENVEEAFYRLAQIDPKYREAYKAKIDGRLELMETFQDETSTKAEKEYWTNIVQQENKGTLLAGTAKIVTGSSGERARDAIYYHFISELHAIDQAQPGLTFSKKRQLAREAVQKELDRGKDGGGGIYSRNLDTNVSKLQMIWTNFGGGDESGDNVSDLSNENIYDTLFHPTSTGTLEDRLSKKNIITKNEATDLITAIHTGREDEVSIPQNVYTVMAITGKTKHEVLSASINAAVNSDGKGKRLQWPVGIEDAVNYVLGKGNDNYTKVLSGVNAQGALVYEMLKNSKLGSVQIPAYDMNEAGDIVEKGTKPFGKGEEIVVKTDYGDIPMRDANRNPSAYTHIDGTRIDPHRSIFNGVYYNPFKTPMQDDLPPIKKTHEGLGDSKLGIKPTRGPRKYTPRPTQRKGGKR